MPWLSVNSLRRIPNRRFHLSAIRSEQNLPKNSINEIQNLDSVPLRKIDKRLLVWSGKYKKFDDVPDRLTRATIAKAHSICRVKVCNYMMIVTLLGAFLYGLSGKREAERGMTRAKLGRQRHEEYMKKLEEERRESMNKS